MPDENSVRTVNAAARPFAAPARIATSRDRLAGDIRKLLDEVWPVLRGEGVRTGHNIVVYFPGPAGSFSIEAGVETFSEFTGSGAVQPASTPSGEVATIAHYGEYSKLGTAYAALEQWCADHGRRPAGVNWEVYGDWDDDPAKVRTDVYFLLAS